MASEHIEGKALDNKGSSGAPQIKQTAKQYLNDSPRGTGSWQLLKDLRMSIVDGGINILKQGMGKLPGATTSAEGPSDQKQTPASQTAGTGSGSPARTASSAVEQAGSPCDQKTQLPPLPSPPAA